MQAPAATQPASAREAPGQATTMHERVRPGEERLAPYASRTGLRGLLYLPPGHGAEPDRRWPLVLSLHGAGERGSDLELVKVHGIPRRIVEGRDFPFIVIAPQCPALARWQPDQLLALLDEIDATHAVDPDRVYVTGISMGGFGTWALAIAAPDRFAAIVPICGGGNPDQVCRIAHVPVWAFHGALDDVVPRQYSDEMVEALRACGGNVRYTVYPHAGHDSWTETYENPELYAWLLAQVRSRVP
jgi:predicted peptidase